MIKWLWRCLLAFLLSSGISMAGAADGELESKTSDVQLPLNSLVDLSRPLAEGQRVADTYPFFGLAHYLSSVSYYTVDADNRIQTHPGNSVQLGEGQWFAAVGRFNVLLLRSSGATVQVADRGLKVTDNAKQGGNSVNAWVLPKSKLEAFSAELNQLRYAQLWAPLAFLSKGMDWLLVSIQQLTQAHWAIVLIIFAVVIKLLMLPASLMTTRLQSVVSKHQAVLGPKVAAIKAAHKGEEAHNRIMAVHKELGITPFFTLKPMLGLFIQIPVLIAVFNALGEMPQFAGVPFLWVADMAYPDAIFRLPITIPWLGNTFNLLPCLMTLVAVLATVTLRDSYSSVAIVRRQKRNLLALAAVFFLLFYPFPAVMVLYWLTANIIQIIQQKAQSLSKSYK